MQLQNIFIIILVIFILYRIFMRVRRSIGWQQLNPRKIRVMTTLLCIIVLIFLVDGAFHPISLISDAVGILIGVILAYYGACLTRFEQRDGRWYYLPNTWIGGILTLLFLGRLSYRIYDMIMMSDAGGLQGNLTSTDRLQNISTGWTSGLLVVMFAYYIVYYIFLLKKQKL